MLPGIESTDKVLLPDKPRATDKFHNCRVWVEDKRFGEDTRVAPIKDKERVFSKVKVSYKFSSCIIRVQGRL
jgi:hypothetical protein